MLHELPKCGGISPYKFDDLTSQVLPGLRTLIKSFSSVEAACTSSSDFDVAEAPAVPGFTILPRQTEPFPVLTSMSLGSKAVTSPMAIKLCTTELTVQMAND